MKNNSISVLNYTSTRTYLYKKSLVFVWQKHYCTSILICTNITPAEDEISSASRSNLSHTCPACMLFKCSIASVTLLAWKLQPRKLHGRIRAAQAFFLCSSSCSRATEVIHWLRLTRMLPTKRFSRVTNSFSRHSEQIFTCAMHAEQNRLPQATHSLGSVNIFLQTGHSSSTRKSLCSSLSSSCAEQK